MHVRPLHRLQRQHHPLPRRPTLRFLPYPYRSTPTKRTPNDPPRQHPKSMRNGTVRSVVAYRQLILILRNIQGRANQHDFLLEVLGRNGVICVHGIENLVSSESVHKTLVSTEQRLMSAHALDFLCCVKLMFNSLRLCPCTT